MLIKRSVPLNDLVVNLSDFNLDLCWIPSYTPNLDVFYAKISNISHL